MFGVLALIADPPNNGFKVLGSAIGGGTGNPLVLNWIGIGSGLGIVNG